MFTVTSRKTQSAICMILSAVIVSVGLSLGAFAAEHAAHHGYSVTVTQIQ
jgi:glycerol dehydrogenase-like iron-containing ADH family enzyme